jgi:hypothetical protein
MLIKEFKLIQHPLNDFSFIKRERESDCKAERETFDRALQSSKYIECMSENENMNEQARRNT